VVEREEAETGTTRKLVGRGAEAEKARSALSSTLMWLSFRLLKFGTSSSEGQVKNCGIYEQH